MTINISKDASDRITVSFPYDPQFVLRVKTIDARKCHKYEKYWNFPYSDGIIEKILKVFESEEIHLDPALKSVAPELYTTHPCPPHRWGREREGVKKYRIAPL
jgi:hypothetical protein